jgi:hypothetical protein
MIKQKHLRQVKKGFDQATTSAGLKKACDSQIDG